MTSGASASAHNLDARVRTHLGSGRGRLRLGGLPAAARACLVATVAENTDRPVWVVTSTLSSARALREDVTTFLAARSLDLPVRVIPGWSDPPDGRLSPDAAGAFERLGALTALVAREHSVVVVPIQSLFQRVMPPHRLREASLELVPAQALSWDALVEALARAGYSRLERVESVGEFAVRGGVVDVFPPDHDLPLRIELEDDALASLRTFDPDNQRSLDAVRYARLGPCREVLFTPERIERAAIRIKTRSDRLGVPKLVRDALIDSIRAELRAPGIEAYWPAFEDERVPVASYREAGDPLIVDQPLLIGRTWADAREALRRWEDGIAESGRLYFPADDFWDREASLEPLVAEPPAIELDPLDHPAFTTIQIEWGIAEPPVPKDVPGQESFDPVAARFAEWLERDLSPLVLASSEGQAARLEQLLGGRGLPVRRVGIDDLPSLSPRFAPPSGAIRVTVGSLSAGWLWPELGIVVVVDEEIFGRKRHTATRRRRRDAPSINLGELQENDHVVHRDFGIGIYRGLKTMAPGGITGDYLQLEYAGGDRLYLPVDRIERVERYVGAGEEGGTAVLSKLGGAGWARTKDRVHKQVLEMAGELANLYAARKLAQGHAFAPPDATFHEFSAAFPFEETPDQARAIEDVLGDLVKPMTADRLVCGDVGYGKTEVAMRAAFLAVLDRKQVAVLVPTTVLAQQHFQTFRERFKGQAVNIESVSRFRSASDTKQVLEGLRKGTVDVIIGTHRLLGADVRFRDLGLVIIDEEHRFGVAHKEKLRRLRTQADVISMTATPIPRTLHMSLSGLRDLSVIATPPEDRQAIRTFVSRYDEPLVQDAIRRELTRGGQVFFVHNRVETIEAQAKALEALVPEAKFAVAHGQMTPATLEKAMLGFVHGDVHVLVTSAIIESGLDIPHANTILINQADRFGLAQLYQLRGRVGRGPVQAYCYLLVPDENRITADAVRRLEALRGLTDLGAGFRLALEDLEIRGAGNLLGKEQSGQIASVGFELYQQMVEEAMAELDGREPELDLDPEIHFPVEAFLPDVYVPDAGERVIAYRQIARARGDDELDEIRWEWIDRFGRLPSQAENLFAVMSVKCDLRRAGATFARQDKSSITVRFHERSPIEPKRFVDVAQRRRGQQPGEIQIHPDGHLSLKMPGVTWPESARLLRNLLAELMGREPPPERTLREAPELASRRTAAPQAVLRKAPGEAAPAVGASAPVAAPPPEPEPLPESSSFDALWDPGGDS